MKANHLRAIALGIMAIPISFLIGYTNDCIYSAVFKMEGRITFSATMFTASMSTPLMCYIFFFLMYYFILNKHPKHNDLILSILIKITVAWMFISPFVSMYITYKATHNGYIECEKISWMSPNNFVKPPETCN